MVNGLKGTDLGAKIRYGSRRYQTTPPTTSRSTRNWMYDNKNIKMQYFYHFNTLSSKTTG